MRTQRLADTAYDHIKQQMLSGMLPVTEWLAVDSFAKQLDASRQPVMDAIKKLSLEGFIEIVPQVGCRLAVPDRREIEDFYRLFARAEGLVAELATERASPTDKIALKQISAQIGDLVELTGDDPKTLGESYRIMNRQLHSEMRRICRSQSLTSVVESLGDRSDYYIAIAQRPVFAENIQAANAEHGDVIEAIIAGNAKKACKLMETHINNTKKRLLSQTTLWEE